MAPPQRARLAIRTSRGERRGNRPPSTLEGRMVGLKYEHPNPGAAPLTAPH